MNLTKKIITLAVAVEISILTGCAAMQTTLEHGKLAGSSQMSESIMLDPVPNSQKSVHVTIKNTSDQQINIASKVKRAIESHGYKVVSNPSRAHYLLQANILKVAKMKSSESKSFLNGGYGSLAGVATGAALVGSLSGSTSNIVGAGLAGGFLEMASNSLIKDINYSAITDVQISERVNGVVTEKTTAHLQNGSSTSTNQTMNRKSKFQRYRTRVVSNVDKVNLQFSEARPLLEASLTKVISGIF